MDRYSIVLGHYVYYALHHTGMGSREYERLSGICDYFTPSLLFSERRFLEGEYGEEPLQVYNNLVEKHSKEIA